MITDKMFVKQVSSFSENSETEKYPKNKFSNHSFCYPKFPTTIKKKKTDSDAPITSTSCYNWSTTTLLPCSICNFSSWLLDMISLISCDL